VGVVVELAPGDAHDAPALRLEGAVAVAVAFEGGAGAVGLVAVELDDEALGGPGEIGLDAAVAGVDERAGEAFGVEEVRKSRSSVLRVGVSVMTSRLMAGTPDRLG
jgi:hypothetical protein